MYKRSFVYLTSCLLCITAGAFGQSLKAGQSLVNLGVGFAGTYHRYSGATGFPALSLTYEYTFPREIGPGLLGLGATFAYRKQTYKEHYSGVEGEELTYRWKYGNTLLALRGTYHWNKLLGEKYDVYGTVLAGMRMEKYKVGTKGEDPYALNVKSNRTRPVAGLLVGARYYFLPRLSVFAELGYDLTWTKVGISGRF